MPRTSGKTPKKGNTKSNISSIIIRQGKSGDELGVYNLMKEGLKRKNWLYTGNNKVSKDKIEKMRKDYLSKKSGSYSFVAIDKSTGKIVGSISFKAKNKGRLRHRVDFGWGVHPDYQGLGIATKLLAEALAFAKKKGYKKACAELAVENEGSKRLALKCGFDIEGTLKKGMLTDDGRYIDTYIVGKWL